MDKRIPPRSILGGKGEWMRVCVCVCVSGLGRGCGDVYIKGVYVSVGGGAMLEERAY